MIKKEKEQNRDKIWSRSTMRRDQNIFVNDQRVVMMSEQEINRSNKKNSDILANLRTNKELRDKYKKRKDES